MLITKWVPSSVQHFKIFAITGKKVCQWSKIGAGVTIQKDILVKSTVFQNHPKIVKI